MKTNEHKTNIFLPFFLFIILFIMIAGVLFILPIFIKPQEPQQTPVQEPKKDTICYLSNITEEKFMGFEFQPAEILIDNYASLCRDDFRVTTGGSCFSLSAYKTSSVEIFSYPIWTYDGWYMRGASIEKRDDEFGGYLKLAYNSTSPVSIYSRHAFWAGEDGMWSIYRAKQLDMPLVFGIENLGNDVNHVTNFTVLVEKKKTVLNYVQKQLCREVLVP